MALVCYPLNNKEYTAEDAELFNCPRSSGVFSGEDFPITADGESLSVKIGVGVAWIRNGRLKGKTIANREDVVLTFDVSSTEVDRVDVVSIGYDASTNDPFIKIKKGTVQGSKIVLPDRSTEEDLYELYLYSVYRPAGSLYISQDDITDLRNDEKYCGYMQDNVTKGEVSAVLDQNKGNSMYFWSGTNANFNQYVDGGKIKPNTVCFVEDQPDYYGKGNYISSASNSLIEADPSGYTFYMGIGRDGTHVFYNVVSKAIKTITCECFSKKDDALYKVVFTDSGIGEHSWRIKQELIYEDGSSTPTKFSIYGILFN